MFSYQVDGQLGYVINPVLTETSGSQDGLEACLSIPGITAVLNRAAHATVAGVNLRQQPTSVAGTGELARCLQHETGHLRGELFIDRLTGPEQRRVMREIRTAAGRAP